MHKHLEGHVYPANTLKADRNLAAQYMESQGAPAGAGVPATYLIFLRGERHGIDLFKDLDIPRKQALHGGQRYEWFAPVGWDDELSVTVTVRKITEKQTKSGTLWFADVVYDYALSDGRTAVRELTRIIKRG